MQGTKAEGAIQKLFVGKMKSYIKCVNVDYESSRSEEFKGKCHLFPFKPRKLTSLLRHST
jgi:hypothetical protein